MAEPEIEESQVLEEPVDVQREVKREPLTEKQYSQKEWTEREVARDREVAQYRQMLSQQALRMEMLGAQAEEGKAQSQDQKAIDRGEITEAEAQLRQQIRTAERQRQGALRQQQQQTEQQLLAAQKVLADAERAGRILAAQDLAKEYGVDAKELLGDISITNYDQMKTRAVETAWKAAKAHPETFDSGHRGGAPASLENMTPMEKIRHGLRQKQRK